MNKVWIVVEETESPVADGMQYTIMGAYKTEQAASNFIDDAKKEHVFEDVDGEPTDWCECHGMSWTMEEVDVVE
jgi:hypothetical protein